MTAKEIPILIDGIHVGMATLDTNETFVSVTFDDFIEDENSRKIVEGFKKNAIRGIKKVRPEIDDD